MPAVQPSQNRRAPAGSVDTSSSVLPARVSDATEYSAAVPRAGVRVTDKWAQDAPHVQRATSIAPVRHASCAIAATSTSGNAILWPAASLGEQGDAGGTNLTSRDALAATLTAKRPACAHTAASMHANAAGPVHDATDLASAASKRAAVWSGAGCGAGAAGGANALMPETPAADQPATHANAPPDVLAPLSPAQHGQPSHAPPPQQPIEQPLPPPPALPPTAAQPAAQLLVAPDTTELPVHHAAAAQPPEDAQPRADVELTEAEKLDVLEDVLEEAVKEWVRPRACVVLEAYTLCLSVSAFASDNQVKLAPTMKHLCTALRVLANGP